VVTTATQLRHSCDFRATASRSCTVTRSQPRHSCSHCIK